MGRKLGSCAAGRPTDACFSRGRERARRVAKCPWLGVGLVAWGVAFARLALRKHEHDWRSRHRDVVHGKGPDIFAGIAPEQTLGLGHVMCVDYAIGHRIRERRAGTTDFKSALAASRWTDGTGTLEFSPG